MRVPAFSTAVMEEMLEEIKEETAAQYSIIKNKETLWEQTERDTYHICPVGVNSHLF